MFCKCPPSTRLFTSRVSDRAALDRYTTIRSFFKRRTFHDVRIIRLDIQMSSDLSPLKRHCAATLVRTQRQLQLFNGFKTYSSLSRSQSFRYYSTEEKGKQTSTEPVDEQKEEHQPSHRHIENYTRFFRRLALSLPAAQRPTREDFLRVASSFWDRLRINFRWFTIRSFRKFNADEISALFTWFLMSQTVWILVGTYVFDFLELRTTLTLVCRTTFFSVIFATVNSLRLQGKTLLADPMTFVFDIHRICRKGDKRLSHFGNWNYNYI